MSYKILINNGVLINANKPKKSNCFCANSFVRICIFCKVINRIYQKVCIMRDMRKDKLQMTRLFLFFQIAREMFLIYRHTYQINNR